MKLLIFGSTLAGIMGVAILSPAIPEIQRALNLSDLQVGMLITVFTLPGIFFSPVLGYLADRFGRGLILSISLILFSVSGFLCAFSDYKLILVLRFLQGVGGSALTSLAVTLIGDLFEGNERLRMLGYNASVLSLGLAIYPLIGGILAEIDWRLPFVSFLSFLPIGFKALRLKSRGRCERFKFELSREVLLVFLLGCLVFIITYGVFYLYLPKTLEEKFNASPILRGLIQSSTLFLTALVASKLEKIVSRLGVYRTIGIGFLGYGVSMLSIPLSPNVTLVAVSTMIYGFGHGTVLPSLQNVLVERTRFESRATVMTTYNSMIRVGQTIGPVIASYLGYSSYELSAILAFLVSLSMLTFLRKR